MTGIKWKENCDCDLDSRQLYARATDLTRRGFVRNDSKLLTPEQKTRRRKRHIAPLLSALISAHCL